MKLPRWLLLGLLSASVLAVLIGGTAWWLAWPTWTAREFVRRCVEEDWGVVNEMFSEEGSWGTLPTALHLDPTAFSSNPRSISDIVIGRLEWTDGDFRIVAERGHVTSAGIMIETLEN